MSTICRDDHYRGLLLPTLEAVADAIRVFGGAAPGALQHTIRDMDGMSASLFLIVYRVCDGQYQKR